MATLQHFCGGTIYTNRWIITSAHCTHDKDTSIRVAIGGHLLSAPGTLHYVEDIIVHDLFNITTYHNDISLVKTNATMGFNAFVTSIPIMTSFIDNGYGITAGWGLTSVI